MDIILKNELFSKYTPFNDTKEIRENIKKILAETDFCIAVLDDDPTGIQTVNGINVYINMDKADIDSAVKNEKVFYVQTNSRGMNINDCKKANETIATKLCEASKKYGKQLIIVSRGDSTLRGHYPLEPDTLRKTVLGNTGKDYDGEIMAPCFFEAGRYTANGIHYVEEGDKLVPASLTEFSKDTTFAFNNSSLKGYIEEKRNEKTNYVDIPLELIREGNIEKITEILMSCENYAKIGVNALCYEDLEVFVLAFYKAVLKGKRFLIRSAASIVRVLGGIDYKEPLTHEDFIKITGKNPKGIVTVGSHVKKTTLQLNRLLTHLKCKPVELDATKLISEDYMSEILEKKAITEEIFNSGFVPVVFTSRAVLTATKTSGADNLKLSTTISERFVKFIDELDIEPNFFIAKGGITSSDMATKACKISKAVVSGQVLPGIPVIEADDNSRWKGLLYIIFPGNVGNENALYDTICKIIE